MLPSPPPHTGKSAARHRGPFLPKIGRHPQVLIALAQPPVSKEKQCARRGQYSKGGGALWGGSRGCRPSHPPKLESLRRDTEALISPRLAGTPCADGINTAPRQQEEIPNKERPPL